MTTASSQAGATAQAALSRLAAALEDAGWGTQLRDGLLHVINRSAPEMRERITVSGGSFCWSWGEPIVELDKTLEVVEKVGVVLAASAGAGGAR